MTPVPANTSKNGRSGTALPRMLNSASRTMSGVGRRLGWTLQFTLRPRNDPDTIRSCARMILSAYLPCPLLLFPLHGREQEPFPDRRAPQGRAPRYGHPDRRGGSYSFELTAAAADT